MSNLRQLGMMTMMYANANRGAFPPTIDHLATMAPGPRPAAVFVCPACGTDPSKPPIVVGKTVSSHYCFVTPASRLMLVKRPANTVLAYEPPTNHDNRGMNILFCDGHVERITGPAMTKIAAELAAGQNPPPSKK